MARHLGGESAESYDGTRCEARLPELTGAQLQAFIAVGRSGAQALREELAILKNLLEGRPVEAAPSCAPFDKG